MCRAGCKEEKREKLSISQWVFFVLFFLGSHSTYLYEYILGLEYVLGDAQSSIISNNYWELMIEWAIVRETIRATKSIMRSVAVESEGRKRDIIIYSCRDAAN